MGLLRLAEKHGKQSLEEACRQALAISSYPSYKGIKNLLATQKPRESEVPKPHGLTRGAAYFARRKDND